MNVGTLPNHIKSCVPWLCSDCLLVVYLLRFRFRCRVFDLVLLCCLISDRSSTIGIRVMACKTSMTTKFDVEKFDGKSNFLLWKMLVTSLLVKEGTHKALLGLRRSHRIWRMISGTISTYAQRRRSYCAYQMRSSTT